MLCKVNALLIIDSFEAIMQQFWQQFVNNLHQTSLLEYIAVFAGIASVWFSRIENIWVYPIGLISTIIYVYLSFNSDLIGEASVNLYYSILSIYGWVLWSRKDQQKRQVLHVSFSTRKEWKEQLLRQVSSRAFYFLETV